MSHRQADADHHHQSTSRNGPGFVKVIRQKHAGNVDYNFHSGREGAAY